MAKSNFQPFKNMEYLRGNKFLKITKKYCAKRKIVVILQPV